MVYWFYCMAIFHFKTRSPMINGKSAQIFRVNINSLYQHILGLFHCFLGSLCIYHLGYFKVCYQELFMPTKELWEAYSNSTVRPSVCPCYWYGFGGLFSRLEIDKGLFLNKGPWPSVSCIKWFRGPQGR